MSGGLGEGLGEGNDIREETVRGVVREIMYQSSARGSIRESE